MTFRENKLIILFILIFSVCARAEVCIPVEVKPESGPQYLREMANSLVHIKDQFNKVDKATRKDSDLTDVFVAMKELASGYICSAEKIEAFKKSKQKNIAESADSLAGAYRSLSDDTQEAINGLKNELNGKAELGQGDRAERSAERMLKIKKLWEIAMLSIAQGTYSVIQTDSKGMISNTLTLTKKERDEAVNILKSGFKLPLKKGDHVPIDSAAGIYHSFFIKPWDYKK